MTNHVFIANMLIAAEQMFENREVVFTDKKNYIHQNEIQVSEIEQQVDYARTVCSDLFRLFSPEEPDADFLESEYSSVRTRLSMMLDFLFQAKLWCEAINSEKEK